MNARGAHTSSAPAFLLVLAGLLGGCTLPPDDHRPAAADDRDTSETHLIFPDTSTFFATAFIEEAAAFDASGEGDLWPSAWSDDDWLYTANGDGKGFDPDSAFADIVMNRVSGHPQNGFLHGERLASGDGLGTVWSDTSMYNRKPSGMLSVGGTLYLAVQDLRKVGPHIFSDAPAATILRSDDKGRTWHWDPAAPMFDDNELTTIMFLDFGRDGDHDPPDGYVYAYGMDHNWRDSFSDVVPDPNRLYLARVRPDAVQDLSQWEFYTGDLHGNASWSAPGRIADRRPVLQDDRRRYVETVDSTRLDSLSVISQGGIVYNRALDRYIYTSWTEYTFEFYEAPAPWGPWRLFLSKDFGGYPWSEQSYGGYATVAPSKFISDDGMVMWISSSTFAGGVDHYAFSLRRLWVTPYEATSPTNRPGDENLAASPDLREVSPISASNVRNGNLTAINDGGRGLVESVDSYSPELKSEDYWGFEWPQAYRFNQLIYTSGVIDEDSGGWFEDLHVQVRQNFRWMDVRDVHVSPAYTYDERVESGTEYTIGFDETWGDGVRIIGRPGGPAAYTSIAELEVYYR